MSTEGTTGDFSEKSLEDALIDIAKYKEDTGESIAITPTRFSAAPAIEKMWEEYRKESKSFFSHPLITTSSTTTVAPPPIYGLPIEKGAYPKNMVIYKYGVQFIVTDVRGKLRCEMKFMHDVENHPPSMYHYGSNMKYEDCILEAIDVFRSHYPDWGEMVDKMIAREVNSEEEVDMEELATRRSAALETSMRATLEASAATAIRNYWDKEYESYKPPPAASLGFGSSNP